MPPALTTIARTLARTCDALAFAPPTAHVYNPLTYGWEAHRQYLERWGTGPKEVLLLGMNPGPFGMVQTAVPFGEVTLVRTFLGIDSGVTPPKSMHPARPIEGFACRRSEVSGARLWGWVERRFGSPQAFFARFFVWNYCPLAFLESSGRNRTPDKLPAAERAPLEAACDDALRGIVAALRPARVIGVGAFAEACAARALRDVADPPHIGRILHPSPASPAANRDWAGTVETQLTEMGIDLAPAAR